MAAQLELPAIHMQRHPRAQVQRKRERQSGHSGQQLLRLLQRLQLHGAGVRQRRRLPSQQECLRQLANRMPAQARLLVRQQRDLDGDDD